MNPTISLAPSGAILVEIPSVLAEGRSYTLEIPMTLGGLSALKKLLVERQRDTRPTIGTRAMPVASDIARYIAKKDSEDRDAAKRASQELQSKYDIEIDL